MKQQDPIQRHHTRERKKPNTMHCSAPISAIARQTAVRQCRSCNTAARYSTVHSTVLYNSAAKPKSQVCVASCRHRLLQLFRMRCLLIVGVSPVTQHGSQSESPAVNIWKVLSNFPATTVGCSGALSGHERSRSPSTTLSTCMYFLGIPQLNMGSICVASCPVGMVQRCWHR